jgi:hypothetical protein
MFKGIYMMKKYKKRAGTFWYLLLVRQKGFEPPTFWFVENLEMCHRIS